MLRDFDRDTENLDVCINTIKNDLKKIWNEIENKVHFFSHKIYRLFVEIASEI